MLDDRVIQDFAQRLVPETFTAHCLTGRHRGHAAVRVGRVRPLGRAPASGSGDPGCAWGGRPIRYVVIEASDGTCWRWDGDPCCEPEWLAEQVCQESHHLREPWFFAVELEWPDPVWEHYDQELNGVVELAQPLVPEGTWPATWYAEARGRGVATPRAGRVDIGREDRLVCARLASAGGAGEGVPPTSRAPATRTTCRRPARPPRPKCHRLRPSG